MLRTGYDMLFNGTLKPLEAEKCRKFRNNAKSKRDTGVLTRAGIAILKCESGIRNFTDGIDG